jgi:GH18 family chitinase
MAGDASYWGTASTPFDRVNVMTYSIGGSQATNGPAWFYSPLWATGGASLQQQYSAYLSAGVPAAKLGIGLAFAGIKLSGGTASHNILGFPTDLTGYVWGKDHSSATNATTWVTDSNSGSGHDVIQGVLVLPHTTYSATVTVSTTSISHPDLILAVSDSSWNLLNTASGFSLDATPVVLTCTFDTGDTTSVWFVVETDPGNVNTTFTITNLSLGSVDSHGISGPRQTWETGQPPTNTYLEYRDILPFVTGSNYTWDDMEAVPYLSNPGTPSTAWFLTYDDPQSIAAKVQYAVSQKVSGWIIWNLEADYLAGNPHPHPLLDAVAVSVASGAGAGARSAASVGSAGGIR